MHAQHVKRLQILIEDDVYAELERISGKTGRSKSALIRELIRFLSHRQKSIRPFMEITRDGVTSADADHA